jgi:hypothetical protein
VFVLVGGIVGVEVFVTMGGICVAVVVLVAVLCIVAVWVGVAVRIGVIVGVGVMVGVGVGEMQISSLTTHVSPAKSKVSSPSKQPVSLILLGQLKSASHHDPIKPGRIMAGALAKTGEL